MKSAALALAFAASVLAEDVAPSFADNPVPPKVTAPPSGPHPDAAQVAGPLTIHVTNSIGPGLYVSFGHNAGSPTAINNPQNGPLGTATQGVYPTNWAGRIAIGKDADPAVIGRGSLIEASFDPLSGVYTPFVDVSYGIPSPHPATPQPLIPTKPPPVQGYTIPITCSCAGQVVTGCNKPLFADGIQCANEGPGPICYNPLNNSGQKEGTAAAPFFEPCQGAAYTYPNDSGAGSYCESNLINCCVGSTCPGDPKQHGKRAEIGGHVKRVAVGAF
ncbi:hypothetical protein ABVK25_008622 [Lepraria finkii]|uniref:Uncharacterized protein n=1 Tax=Lepraria finkii TaxID=1340010 RepID=A0ABR4AZF0_9LECA